MPKLLLIAMATVEAATGVSLLAAPSFVVGLLLGNELSSPGSLVLGRILGAALVSIGVACWSAKNSEPRGCAGLLCGMCFYNFAVPGLLVLAAFVDGLQGVALWPACILHLALAIGCTRLLLQR